MKLQRVRLLNYRGVTESDVRFSQTGVTIVEGRNEVGKTSIPEALELAIEVPDSSQRAQIKSIKPVDRDEGPQVEITLSSGQYDLVYEKRWLRNPMTTLKVSSPLSESHTGREAHDRLRAILAETLDQDLWRALRIEQGIKLKLPPFAMPSMRRALDRAAGGDLASDLEDSLWERIKAEYGRYWTPTGQAKGERKLSESRATEAENKVANLKDQIEDVERDVIRMVRLVEEGTRVSATRDEYEKSERDFAKQWASIERMRTEVDRLGAHHSSAEAEHDRAAGEWNLHQELIDTLSTRTEDLTTLKAQAAPELAAAIPHSEKAAADLKVAAAALRSAEDKRGRANEDRDFLRQQIEVAQLSERYERYTEAEQALKEAEDFLEVVKVDDDVVTRIEQAHLNNVRAGAIADGAAASVETTALGDIRLQIDGEVVELAANEVSNTLVEDEVVFVVPGIARMRVSAGAKSKELAERHRSTREAYRRLCNEVGVVDLAEARKAAQARRDAERTRQEAIKTIARDLRDLTPDVLQGKIKNLTMRVTCYPQVRPEDPPLPSDFEEAQRIASEAESLVTDSQASLYASENTAKNAESELNKARLNDVDRTARIEVARASKEQAASRLAQARAVQADQALVAALVVAEEKFDRALKSLEEVRAKLNAADPDSLETLLVNAGGAKRRAVKELESNRNSQNEVRARLDLRGEQGLQGLYDQALSELEQIKRKHESTEARAMAALLLRETFEKQRRQAHQRYIEPFKERTDQFGRIVFGPTFTVELDENLRVVRRTLNGTALNIDQLSTGAREQLGVISRLACAAIVSPGDGGVPVMIADALGWSDPQRLQGMGAAIAAAGKLCQVVVLTCTPGRYSHVGSARVVILDA